MPELPGSSPRPPVSRSAVCAVLVLYRSSLEESRAWRSLIAARNALPDETFRFRVIIYDNSPVPADLPPLPGFAVFVSDPQNRGLAHAYNFALAEAEGNGYDWLLTLDHDTALPEDFLNRMLSYLGEVRCDPTIAAVVPQLCEGDILLSPRSVRFARTRAVRRGFVGVAQDEVHAFNSAALWRVHALRHIGGFCEYFWLDHLDIWTHRQLHRAGYRIFIAGGLQLEHNLSLLNYKARITPQRYECFLQAEGAFVDICNRPPERAALTCRLLLRLFRQWMRGEAQEIRGHTLRALKERLLQRRRERIARWKEWTVNRFPSADERRPPVSVCMAACNGERYITEQLRSILSQLSADDELIVVDDGSGDRTRECVRSLCDERIRLLVHEKNLGVLRSFEDAIRQANHSIIFLSDQDDVWRADKVPTVLQAFATHPEADVIVSGVCTIDAEGNMAAGPARSHSVPFRSGFWANLIRNRYQGCTMAFRARILPEVLPLPHGYDVLHDIWIGVRNALSNGGALYIDEPLVMYRRHAGTVTGRRTLSALRRLRVRVHLVRALLEFARSRRISAAEAHEAGGASRG